MFKALAVPFALLHGVQVARAACGADDGSCDSHGDDAASMMQLRKAEQAALIRRGARVSSPEPMSVCAPGASVQCLGDSGVSCAGNQCCPGVGDGPTYPCPSATSDVEGCGTDIKVLDCLQQPGSDLSKALSSVPYIGSKALGASEPTGKIKINEDGVINEYWLPGATTIDNSTTVKYEPPYRFYLMNKYTLNYSNPDDFYFPPLIGKTFSVDFDFGTDGAGCGCNLNFYLVGMPVSEPGKDGDYYCDAQCFEDLGCCPEFDMNEGNMMTQQITNHACTNDYVDHSDWQCHKWGDPEVKTTALEFSPGSSHIIDSSNKFTYEQQFKVEGNEAVVVTRIVQGDSIVVKTMGPGSSQLNSMFTNIQDGMAFVTGYWFASDMNWLDGEECGSGSESCDKKPVYLSNWKITTDNNVPWPTPSPSPSPPPPSPTPSTDGKCCWGDCGGCGAGMTGWCNENSGNCDQCGGGVWCS